MLLRIKWDNLCGSIWHILRISQIVPFFHPLACVLFRPNLNTYQHSKLWSRTVLVVQWIKIHLPMQEPQVWSLVQEDSTCHGATKPMSRSYCAWVPRLLKPVCLHGLRSATGETTTVRSPCPTTKSSPYSAFLEKACAQQRRPSTTK